MPERTDIKQERVPDSWRVVRSVTIAQVTARVGPGSDGALLRRRPLRTVRASFPAHGSSKPCGPLACSVLACRFAGRPAVAVGVQQTESRIVRAAVLS